MKKDTKRIAEFILGMVDMSVTSELPVSEQLEMLEKELANIEDTSIYYYLLNGCDNQKK